MPVFTGFGGSGLLRWVLGRKAEAEIGIARRLVGGGIASDAELFGRRFDVGQVGAVVGGGGQTEPELVPRPTHQALFAAGVNPSIQPNTLSTRLSRNCSHGDPNAGSWSVDLAAPPPLVPDHAQSAPCGNQRSAPGSVSGRPLPNARAVSSG